MQETYSTPEVENIWKSQWRGDIFFSHGSEHSRGVMILLKEKFDCEVKVHREDEQGRLVILKSLTQSQPFVYVNIYAPNKVKDQCIFFEEIQKQLDELELEENCEVIIGGDFNVILDADLDGTGGKPQVKESCKQIDNLCSSFDLIDIWRIRNPDVKHFTCMETKEPNSTAPFGFLANHQQYSRRGRECRYYSCNKNRSFCHINAHKRN